MGQMRIGLFLLLFSYMVWISFRPDPGITAMEALDIVKERYATNFDKVVPEDQVNSADRSDPAKPYYYKLDTADYYLVYEGLEEDGLLYLIHLYEFVLDEPESGIGHTVTYGWYKVNRRSGAITEWIP